MQNPCNQTHGLLVTVRCQSPKDSRQANGGLKPLTAGQGELQNQDCTSPMMMFKRRFSPGTPSSRSKVWGRLMEFETRSGNSWLSSLMTFAKVVRAIPRCVAPPTELDLAMKFPVYHSKQHHQQDVPARKQNSKRRQTVFVDAEKRHSFNFSGTLAEYGSQRTKVGVTSTQYDAESAGFRLRVACFHGWLTLLIHPICCHRRDYTDAKC
ncbi:hypothetical protein N657DRAFT_360975 [Parathielavia appendiculata]|uniref:Uncharacterized protein n=1 Tax=Parathielavia appendiculata TaxID=2587402 RepID=A0AAN6U2I2_9PEZI|nr:hypothetical protein N657DRAFT_360975 [Parathielavia appendiculata]